MSFSTHQERRMRQLRAAEAVQAAAESDRRGLGFRATPPGVAHVSQSASCPQCRCVRYVSDGLCRSCGASVLPSPPPPPHVAAA